MTGSDRSKAGPPPMDPGNVLLEYIPIGRSVKVCAVDPVTGTEVVSIGPIDSGREQLARLAVQKLRFVLARRNTAR